MFRYGRATTTTERRSVAHRDHNRAQRLAAKQSLQRSSVKFTDAQVRAVGRGFAKYVERHGLPVWACAIMPDHVHLVTGRAGMAIEKVVLQLKASATRALIEDQLHPFGGEDKCFARGEWKVYLDPPDIPRSVRYVELNPEKEGLPAQRWDFVTAPQF